MRGMEQYMRNKQHARNLDKEQRAREQKAFLLEVKGRLNPCTIPEPFALKTELREVRTTCTSSVLSPSLGLLFLWRNLQPHQSEPVCDQDSQVMSGGHAGRIVCPTADIGHSSG